MLSLADRWISAADTALRTLSGAVSASRPTPTPTPQAVLAPSPAPTTDPDADARAEDAGAPGAERMPERDRRLSGALMRVNHVGEVCAQALYEAQALTARSDDIREQMRQAAREEIDHLAWTAERLRALGDHRSRLNPLWYAGAFGIGLAAGRLGDRWSLGFLVETERQVERHLDSHLDRLPPADLASRAIVRQMAEDEARHADMALKSGGHPLPWPARMVMRAAAKVMTTTAHYV